MASRVPTVPVNGRRMSKHERLDLRGRGPSGSPAASRPVSGANKSGSRAQRAKSGKQALQPKALTICVHLNTVVRIERRL